MSELKAAPGPWVARDNKVYVGKRFVCEVHAGAELNIVAMVSRRNANAALIAAAPELYSALATLMLYFTSGNSVPVEKATIQTESEDIKRGFAALQKARGE